MGYPLCKKGGLSYVYIANSQISININVHLPWIRNQIECQTGPFEAVHTSTESYNFIYTTVLEPGLHGEVIQTSTSDAPTYT